MERSALDIKQDVTEHILWDARVEGADIEVECDERGVITLQGRSPSYLARQAAGQDALSIPGVRSVNNQVTVQRIRKGPERSGEELCRVLRDLFALYPNLAEEPIKVEVSDGIVALHGSVDAYWKKLRAEELAFDVAGVKEVKNMLTVAPSGNELDRKVAEDIEAALRRTGKADPARVTVVVDGGRVTLSGTVDDWESYSAAHAAAKYTRGVVDLTNELSII
ncbi:MAG: BON domain-containing protein [Chitinivibrionales bacterium]|nr:BON domain-containing protein [Chitinivibrionales bacterium]MBD3357768.1 BON domain-containing protein [Chitinivibrionales bacterium]